MVLIASIAVAWIHLAAEAATVPVLREALSELKAEREHWELLATDLMQRRRRWWPWRRTG